MRASWFYTLSAVGIRSTGLVAKFLLVLCFVRYFQPSELGLYGIMAAMVAYALFFLGFEFYNHVSRALIDATPIAQVIIIRDQFILYAIAFMLMLPIFYWAFYTNILPRSLVSWFIILVITEHCSNELMRILIALSKPYLANVVFFIRQGIWMIILLPLFYFIPSSRQFNFVFIAWTIGAFISIGVASIGLYHLPWRHVWHAPIDWSHLKIGLKISRPFMLSAFCALSMVYIERFFVNYYCGLDAVGIYTFYAGLSITLHNLANTGVSKMRLSHLLAAWKQNNIYKFNAESMRMLNSTIIFVIAFALLSLILINPFMNYINKSVYLDQINIFYVLLFSAACRSIADVPLYTIYAQHRDTLLLLINAVPFVIMLIGNILLIPRLGLMGAALSSAAASIILLVYALCMRFQKNMKPYVLAEN